MINTLTDSKGSLFIYNGESVYTSHQKDNPGVLSLISQ